MSVFQSKKVHSPSELRQAHLKRGFFLLVFAIVVGCFFLDGDFTWPNRSTVSNEPIVHDESPLAFYGSLFLLVVMPFFIGVRDLWALRSLV
jgi:hypothetical protein